MVASEWETHHKQLKSTKQPQRQWAKHKKAVKSVIQIARVFTNYFETEQCCPWNGQERNAARMPESWLFIGQTWVQRTSSAVTCPCWGFGCPWLRAWWWFWNKRAQLTAKAWGPCSRMWRASPGLRTMGLNSMAQWGIRPQENQIVVSVQGLHGMGGFAWGKWKC